MPTQKPRRGVTASVLSSLVLISAAVGAGVGCGTMNTARPLEPGQHAVAGTVGGPLIELYGLVFPLPTSNVEGRSGLTRLAGKPLDVNYGLHLTSLLFGDAGVHAGASYLLLRQQDYLPALSVAGRTYFFTNIFDARKPTTLQQFWAVEQIELTASYVWSEQMLYLGLADYIDLEYPSPFLAPFLGVELHPGLDWLGLQLEARWLLPWVDNRPATPKWIAPFDRGGVLISAGASLRFDLIADREEAL